MLIAVQLVGLLLGLAEVGAGGPDAPRCTPNKRGQREQLARQIGRAGSFQRRLGDLLGQRVVLAVGAPHVDAR